VGDEQLEAIYGRSHCLIAASEGEGFGLPLIEAVHHKLTIIARDIPVFREVAGEHAYFFDAPMADGLVQTVKYWLELFENGQHPKSDDIPWLTREEGACRLSRIILGTTPAN
jgi:glycosyltransferase involved in cell wall biosynthesis